MISIDQNCHSLWDVLPKLHALTRRGLPVRHCVEDIDVAFTAVGASADGPLALARERFHRSGGADWGAAMFYHEFLGRQPVEIRRWEPALGMKISAVAHQLRRPLDELYDRYSPSDNWQLIGPSYVADREHHRVIGDLTVAETRPFVKALLARARANCLRALPQRDSQQRLGEWFNAEEARVARLLKRCADGRLVDLYNAWMGEHLGAGAELDLTSSLLAIGADADRTAVMDAFVQDYETAAGLYNQAVAETDVGLHPLDTARGELPFFATLWYHDHLVRAGAYLDGQAVRVGERRFPLSGGRLPLEALRAGGVVCLAGKALLLVIQVRCGARGEELALPHNGSLYMPAAHALARKLAAARLLPQPLRPIVRVRFGLLDRLRGLDTVIRLPDYLAGAMGQEQVPAAQLGGCWRELARDAAARLEAFKDDDARRRWQREAFGELADEDDELETRRRELARNDPKSERIRQLGRRQKDIRTRLLEGLLERVAADWHLSQVDYWDSRGAMLPWCIGLGGRSLYDELVANAELIPE